MILIYGYLKKKNSKVLKFHMNNSSYFDENISNTPENLEIR